MTAPGNGRRPHRQLLVVVGDEAELAAWQHHIDVLGHALGLQLATAVVPRAPHEASRLSAVLRRAADARGPVMVVPTPPGRPVAGAGAAELRRVLVPFDTSDEVTSCARPVLRSLQAAGIHVLQLHVLTGDTMPVMWEGSGHHATAWRTELDRRHRVGDSDLEIVVAPVPGAAVAARSTGADLVVLCWTRSPEDGRAATIRHVLGAVDVPVLLLPLP